MNNAGHLSHGALSQKKLEGLQAALAEEHTRILRAKGFTLDDADPVMSRVVEGFTQSVVMMHSYFDFLMQSGGPISVKGRTRRAVEGWSRAADRVAKFATMLGLQRKARRVNETPAEWLERIGQQQQQQSNVVEREEEHTTDENKPGACETGRQMQAEIEENE